MDSCFGIPRDREAATTSELLDHQGTLPKRQIEAATESYEESNYDKVYPMGHFNKDVRDDD